MRLSTVEQQVTDTQPQQQRHHHQKQQEGQQHLPIIGLCFIYFFKFLFLLLLPLLQPSNFVLVCLLFLVLLHQKEVVMDVDDDVDYESVSGAEKTGRNIETDTHIHAVWRM